MLRIGILGKSEIAQRRFLPALEKSAAFEFAGFASRENNNYESYDKMVNNPSIDAVYIPLPPSLHYKWAKKALLNGKHVMIEKPCTTNFSETKELIKIAEDNNLALHENYMFSFHSQLDFIKERVPEIGELRLIRCDFGFPFRGATDFRYSKELGGGALLDCGGYPLKLASILMGDDIRLISAYQGFKPEFEVDIYGFATLIKDNIAVQIGFGMDNSYRCDLNIWGSCGSISTDRIFTAPSDYNPNVFVNGDMYRLSSDDSFAKSIEYFATLPKNYNSILVQAKLIDSFITEANR